MSTDSSAETETAVVTPSTSSAANSGGAGTSRVELELGAQAGRYAVLEELGRGGMGRVVRAYDPKLQREVALKEVRRKLLGEEFCLRLVAEARAMAKLSHPNVVAVYDIHEADDGRLLLVMEFIPGSTLGQWQSEAERSWSKIVARYIDAGRGLSAAHEAGLLHRDFKPANVLVTDEDSGALQVKVTDFGLAKQPEDDTMDPLDMSDTDLSDSGMTQAGTVMGTPRYMAPEQHAARPLTSAADQYAFCVALWEALCGAPPFAGESIGRDKFGGPPGWPRAGIPRYVTDAIRRGLDPQPEQRWPDMLALLDALGGETVRRRKRWLLGAGGVLVVAGGVAGLRAGRSEPCSGAADQVQRVWSEHHRAEIQTAMAATGTSYASRTFEQTSASLDGYANAWTRMHRETCEATTVRGEQSTEVMDLRMACLHRALVELDAVTAELRSVDRDSLPRAHTLTTVLPPLARCADADALRADVAPPLAAEASEVEEVRVLLAETKAARQAGRYDAAAKKLQAARQRARDIEYGPLHGEVAFERGEVLDRRGDLEGAETSLREALRIATRYTRTAQMGEIATQLIHVVGHHSRKPELALRYRELAEELNASDPRAAARTKAIIASVLRTWGKLDEAETEQRAALAMRKELLPAGDNEIADSHNNLANVLRLQKRFDEAEAEHRIAIEIREKAIGPEHPATATSYNNLANVMRAQARYDEAEKLHRHALKLRIAALGEDHHDVATSRNNLANVFLSRGDYTAAEAEHRKVLALRERLLDPTHPDIAMSCANISAALGRQGKHAEARTFMERALEVRIAALGPEHPDVASGIANLGVNSFQAGDLEQAQQQFERALELRKKILRPGHPDIATTMAVLAGLMQEAGDEEGALQQFERALELLDEALGTGHIETLKHRNNYAVALHGSGDEQAAEAEFRRVLEHAEASLPADHPELATARSGLANVLVAQERSDEALAYAEAAWEVRGGPNTPPGNRAETAWVLARIYDRTGARKRAIEFGRIAQEGYRQSGKRTQSRLETVSDWLEARGG